MAKTKEVVKIQDNSSVFLSTVEKFHISNAKTGDYLIKVCDTNDHGKDYIGLYKPDTKDDLKLVEEFKKLNEKKE
jgi:hypothetical protein